MPLLRALVALQLILAIPCFAEDQNQQQGQDDFFENPDTYLDTTEAVRSKQYVHRTILNTVIQATSRFSLGRFYLNHLFGYSAILQRKSPGIKYSTPLQGLAAGYVSSKGHGFEIGAEISQLTNVYAGYRYFLRPEKLLIWPNFGIGGGMQLSSVKFSSGPVQSNYYTGSTAFGYAVISLLVPLVDVGLRAEVRFSFYALNRVVFTQGIGAIIFL